MRLQDDIDFTTLTWVKQELDDTLKQAQQALEAYVEDTTDKSQMRFCASYLHQVQGTLRMVELYGGAMVVEEMERLALGLLDGKVKQADDAYTVLMRGMVQLPDYLERLQSGHRDIPIVLLPLLNDLRACRGEKLLSETSLFSPDLGAGLPASAVGAKAPTEQALIATNGGRLRLAFQFGLLKWFKGDDVDGNLTRLIAVVDRIRGMCVQLDARRLFWVAGGALEAVLVKGLDSSVAFKVLVGRVDREIKRLIDGGEAAFAATPPSELSKGLLYYVAHSTATSTRVQELRQVYRLDKLVPSKAELDHARGALTGHNRALLETVGTAIKEDLLRVKDALDLYLRTGSGNTEDLFPQIDALHRVADTLGMLGLGVPRRVVLDQQDVVARIVAGKQSADESTLLDIAGSLLYVESSLDDHIERLGADPRKDVAPVTGFELPQAEVRRILDATTKEASANIQQAKQDIVAFIESPWDHSKIEQIPRLLDEISGALRMLNLPEPAALLGGVVRFAEVELLKHRRVPSGDQLDLMADAIASIEFFLEAVKEGRRNRDKILDVTRRSLEALGYWPIPVEGEEPAALDAAAEAAADSTPSSADFPSFGDGFTTERTQTPVDNDLAALEEAHAASEAAAPVSADGMMDQLIASYTDTRHTPVEAQSDASADAGIRTAVEIAPGDNLDSLIVGHTAPEAVIPSLQDLAGLQITTADIESPREAAVSAHASDLSAREEFSPQLANELLAPLDSLSWDADTDSIMVADDEVASAQLDLTTVAEDEDRQAHTREQDVLVFQTEELLDRAPVESDYTVNGPDPVAPAFDWELAAPAPSDVVELDTRLPQFETQVDTDIDAALDALIEPIVVIETADEDAVVFEPPVIEVPVEPIAVVEAQPEPLVLAFEAPVEVVPDVPVATIPPQPTPPAPVLVQAVPPANFIQLPSVGFHSVPSDEIDDEIREVFVEEVQDELDNLSRQYPAWKRDVNDMEKLKPLRRSFHTLKGSGRLVGALAIGEFAWRIENLLNRLLDKSVSPTPAVLDLLDHGIAALPGMLSALKGEGQPDANVGSIMWVADQLTAGQDVWLPKFTPAPVDTAEAEPASVAGIDEILDSSAELVFESASPAVEENERETVAEAQALKPGISIEDTDEALPEDNAESIEGLNSVHEHSAPVAVDADADAGADADADDQGIEAEHAEIAREWDEFESGENLAFGADDSAILNADGKLKVPELEVYESASSEGAAPSGDAELSPLDVDPLLMEILSSEVSAHLAIIADYLKQGDHAHAQPVTEELLRAVHTLNGALSMVDLPVLMRVVAPLEGYLKRLRARQQRPSEDGFAAIEDSAACIAQVMRAIEARSELPDTEMLAERVLALRDDLPAPDHPYHGFELHESEDHKDEMSVLNAVEVATLGPATRPWYEAEEELGAVELTTVFDASEETSRSQPEAESAVSGIDSQLPMSELVDLLLDDGADRPSSEVRSTLPDDDLALAPAELDAYADLDFLPASEDHPVDARTTSPDDANVDDDLLNSLQVNLDGAATSEHSRQSSEAFEPAENTTLVSSVASDLLGPSPDAEASWDAAEFSNADSSFESPQTEDAEALTAVASLFTDRSESSDRQSESPVLNESADFYTERSEVGGIEETDLDLLLQAQESAHEAVQSDRHLETETEEFEIFAAPDSAFEAGGEPQDGISVTDLDAWSLADADASHVAVESFESLSAGLDDESLIFEIGAEPEPIVEAASESWINSGSDDLSAQSLSVLSSAGDHAIGAFEDNQLLIEAGQEPLLEDPAITSATDANQAADYESAVGTQLRGPVDVDPAGPLDLPDMDVDLLDIFAEEAVDILDHADGMMVRLRHAPEDKEAVASLQRDLHTLKGGARMAGLYPIGDLSHVMESLFEAIANAQRKATRPALEALERAFDRMHGMVSRVRQRQAIALPEHIIARLEAILEGRENELLAVEAAVPVVVSAHVNEETSTPANALPADASPAVTVESAAAKPPISRGAKRKTQLDEDEGGARASHELIRVRADMLDNLVNFAGEVSIYRSRLETQMGGFRFNLVEFEQTVLRLREQLRKLEMETEAQILSRFQRESEQSGNTEFDPLELDRFSTLQQLSRALAESVSDLVSIQNLLDDIARQSETLLLQQSRVSSDLQEGLMRTRMVPFESLVPRLRRILRQTATELGKKAQLKVEGTQGEMDRTVLERMTAPFEHMLRNSLAHGIESPEVRRAKGKPEEGSVSIKVAREATEVLILVTDDGAGMNRDAIRRKAIERNLMTPEAQLSDRDIFQFVLEAGFSTASEVSKVAGRGVGMDVVASEVKQLGGSLEIDSEFGKGTRISIRLPFTLAVAQAVMVRLGEGTYAIPMSSITGVTRMPRKEMDRRLDQKQMEMLYNGETYQIYDLGDLLRSPVNHVTEELQVPMLMSRTGDQRAAIRVSQVIGSKEVVVKSAGAQLSIVPGIFGATIMGDGRVVVILDLAPLVRHGVALRQAPELAAELRLLEPAPEPAPRRQMLVMVVDDSITMRKVTTRVLERSNYDVFTAKDGLDAVEQLQDRMPDVILLDIEMPRMDGYEVATYIRNDLRLKHIPIIMITSRTGEKHRQRALEVGVDRYLGKPYQETDLLKNVAEALTAGHANVH